MVLFPGGPLPRFSTPPRPWRFRLPPTGVPSWCISLTPTTACPGPFGRRLPGHPVALSRGRNPCHASLFRHANDTSGRLLPAHTGSGTPWGGYATHSYLDISGPHSPDSYRCTQLVHFPGGASALTCYLGTPTPPPTGTCSWYIFLEGPLLCLLISARPRRFWPSPTGPPSWCMSLEGIY